MKKSHLFFPSNFSSLKEPMGKFVQASQVLSKYCILACAATSDVQ